MAAAIANFLLLLLVTSVPPVSLTTTLRTSSDHCRYPATMYLHRHKTVRDMRQLKWYIYSADATWGKAHTQRMVDFDEDRIFVHYGEHPFDPEREADITYACIDQLDDYKYIVTKQRRHREHMYQCIQFIIRSDTVVQWKLSAESEVHADILCDDQSLKLHEEPLVFYKVPEHWNAGKTRQRTYVPCPMQGGFFISQWGNATHDSSCRTNIPPTKLESECGMGDGIRYQVGNGGSCSLPFVAQSTTRQLYCIAAWENKEFTFAMVAAKDQAHSISCMRFPTMHGHSFTAHVFTDGVCRMGYDLQNNPHRRSITMSPHIETTLCGDDTQACVMTPNLQCIETISRACRETCNTCPYPIPWDKLKIARQFQGRWVFYRGELSHEVAITDEYIEIPTLGKYKIFVENKCPETGADVTSGKKRYIFVTEFDNGCSPRLTAIEMFKRSDAVISLRLSNSWPIDYTVRRSDDGLDFVITGWDEWCQNLRFRDGPIDLDDSFRTDKNGWYNLIHKDRTSMSHKCSFPENLHRMHLSLASGVRCTAQVVQDSDRSFSIKLDACKSNAMSPRRRDREAAPARTQVLAHDDPIGSPISVTCLAAFGGRARGTLYFVTRTTSEARVAGRRFMCWSLDLDGLRGLLLPVSDCDDNSAHQVTVRAQRSAYGSLSVMSTYIPAEPEEPAEPIQGATRTNAATPTKLTNTNIAQCLFLLSLLLLL